MVDISDLGGTADHVAPEVITAVAGPSLGVPRLGLQVFGIDAAPVSTGEAPDAIMATAHPDKPFARLTRPDGSPMLIRGSAVRKARQPLHSEVSGHPPGAVKLIVFIRASAQAVRESIEQARPLLVEAGSRIFG